MNSSPHKKVSIVLWIGIFFFPFIFAWFSLKKDYSYFSKIVSFAWFIFCILIISLNKATLFYLFFSIWVGIVFFPFIFAWFSLKKDYSHFYKIVSLAWVIFWVLLISFNKVVQFYLFFSILSFIGLFFQIVGIN